MATSFTPATRTTITNILKQDYAPEIIALTKEQTVLLDKLQSVVGKVPFGGTSFLIPLEGNNMGGVGSRAESGDLPDSVAVTWNTTTVPIYYHYFTVAATGPAMATSRGNKYAFAEAWTQTVVRATKSFRQHTNRMMCGDGNGILAQVDGSVAAQVITVDNAYGISGFNSSDVNGARFLTGKMKIDVYSGSSLRGTGNWLVDSYTTGAFPSTSATITVNSTHTISAVQDGDYVYVAGSYGNEAPGIRLMVDDGTLAATFQSLAYTTEPEWRSYVGYGSTPGTAEAITRQRMNTLQTEIESYGGGMVDFWFTSPAVWLTIGEAMAQENVITNQATLDNGYTVIMFNGKPIFKDPYATDELFALDTRAIKLHEVEPAGWLEEGDSGVIRKVSSKDEWEASWAWYMTPAIHNRRWCGKIVDISVGANMY